MTNKTVDQDALVLQEKYDSILRKIVIIDVSFISLRDNIMKLITELPFEEGNKLVNFNTDLGVMHQRFSQELHEFENDIRQKRNELIIKEGRSENNQ
jgi:hypothetical protein